jgi:hypothetical protein
MNRPFIHVAAVGVWGGGKTHLAATFPKPLISLQTDPYGKEGPILNRGIVDQTAYQGEFGQYLTKVHSKVDPERLLCQIEYFHDPDPRKPAAFNQFRNRFDTLYPEIAAGKWATVVVDGLTFLEMRSRKLAQYMTVRGKDPRRWYASSKEDLEEMIADRAGSMRCNVVVCVHLDPVYDEELGHDVYKLAAPGKLSGRFGAGFPEMYVCHGLKQVDGKMNYWLQTRTDTKCKAESVFLEASDPCEAHYAALWSNYDTRHGVKDGGTTADNGGDATKQEEK